MNFNHQQLEPKEVCPKDQQYIVQAWIVRHEKELLANWELLHGQNATFFRIGD